MMLKPDDFVMKAWKQQVGASWRLIETITAESKKLREYQVSAAAEAHAAAAAARERFEKAAEVQELWRIQGEWLQGSAEKSIAYWRRLFEGAAQLQAAATRCVWERAGVTDAPASDLPFLGMMDEAYKRWLDTANRFYAAPAPASAPARKAA